MVDTYFIAQTGNTNLIAGVSLEKDLVPFVFMLHYSLVFLLL